MSYTCYTTENDHTTSIIWIETDRKKAELGVRTVVSMGFRDTHHGGVVDSSGELIAAWRNARGRAIKVSV